MSDELYPGKVVREGPERECGGGSGRAKSSFAAPAGSVASGVITELNLLRDWIKDGSGYNRDDAPDEIARAIANRIREIEARESTMPPNAALCDAGGK